MIRQYPYNLEIQKITESEYIPETGEYSKGGEEWVFVAKCRDEAGTGRKITTPDGESYMYGTLVQLPKGTDGIKPGDKIRVVDECGEIIFTGSVAKFKKNQLHSRLWV